MRGESIPAWTVLREPSASSAAPSEDELQPSSSQDMVDEIAHTPPVQPPPRGRMRPPPSPSTSRVSSGGRNGESSRTQLYTPVSRMPPPPPPSSAKRPLPSVYTRRPLPQSDSDEEEQRPKKKKRKIVDPEKGPALASTRVSLRDPPLTNATRLGQSLKHPPSTAPASSDAARNRRATLDIDAMSNLRKQTKLGAWGDDRGQNGQSASSSSRPSLPSHTQRPSGVLSVGSPSSPAPRHGPRSNRVTPTASVSPHKQPRVGPQGSSKRPTARKSADSTSDDADPHNDRPRSSPPTTTASIARRASAPAVPPHEVIEILDSDEENTAPPRPKPRPVVKKTFNPSSTQKMALPRRIVNKPALTVDDAEVIIIEDSDDEPAPQSQKPPQSQPPTPVVARRVPSPSSHPLEVQNTTRAAETRSSPSPARASGRPNSPPIIPPHEEDVEMADEAAMVPELQEEELVPSDFDMSGVEDNPLLDLQPELEVEPAPEPEPEPEPSIAVEPTIVLESTSAPLNTELSILVPMEDHLAPTGPPTIEAPTSLKAAVPTDRVEGSPSRETSTLRTASPPQVDTQTPMLQPSPTGQTQVYVPLTFATPPSSNGPSGLRAETASPVSSVLDSQLQSLVISPSSGEVNATRQELSSSISRRVTPPESPVSARTRSPKSRSPLSSRVRMRGTLYSGPSGFFSSVLRLSQKKRASTRSRSPTVAPGSRGFSLVRPSRSPSPAGSNAALVKGIAPEPTRYNPEVAAKTAREIPMEGILIQEDVSPRRFPGAGQEMDTSTEERTARQSSIVAKVPGLQEEIHQVGRQISAAEETSAESVVETIATAIPESRSADRSNTPPAVDVPTAPLGPTLSQIIRNAANENARRNIIDLTNDKSDDESATQSALLTTNKDKPVVSAEGPSLASPVTPLVSPATPNDHTALHTDTQPAVKMLDLNAIRSVRKPHSRPPRQLSQSPIIPLPRNIRRASAVVPKSGSSQSMKSPVMESVTTTKNLSFQDASSESSGAPAMTAVTPAPATKLTLPRRRDLRIAQSDQVTTPGNLDRSQSSSISATRTPTVWSQETPISSAFVSPARVTNANGHASPQAIPSSNRVRSPAHSGSPTAEAAEEDECLDLVYPSTTPEDSPEVELADEDEHPVRPRTSRRTRSQAASSSASSSASGPRRSVRFSSSSASSSAEPPELPRLRLRRREPFIRTLSDDDVVSHGGISRSTREKYAQVFEGAGFESLSWKKDKRRVAKEFAPITQSAEDIPHDLQDRLNALSLYVRRASNMQALVFEAEIHANTADDEPNAPPIRIINNVDDEPTPPLEFYYSNLMWHGRDVPRPNYESLEGCGCVGPCDPASKTCLCVQRQTKFRPSGGGFIYDKKGKLISDEYPVFECNMNCGCSDDCPNRVMQQGRQYEIAIQKTPNKGWGVFAGPKKIPAYSYLGVYAGEYLTDAEGESRGLFYNKFGRTYLFDVDFWHTKDLYGKDPKYCIDAYHAGNFTRYLNHSCDPNCSIVAGYINESNIEKPLLAIFTNRDVEPFEELCFSYFGNDTGESDEDEDDDEDDGHANKKGPSESDTGAVYVKCQCGARQCKGTMWR